jgi:hypothetical protein
MYSVNKQHGYEYVKYSYENKRKNPVLSIDHGEGSNDFELFKNNDVKHWQQKCNDKNEARKNPYLVLRHEKHLRKEVTKN